MRAMQVRDTSEFNLIEKLAGAIAEDNAACIARLDAKEFRLRLGIGDDAAAWDAPAGTQVLTTDTMVEGVHFNLGQISWRDLGWKALASNLSDVAAMGCTPLYSVITLGLRGDLPVDGLVDMYRGMVEVGRTCGAVIAGGDIVRSPVFFVTVALTGTATTPDGPLLTRAAAVPGDQVAVTGSLGCSAGGFRMLTENLEFDDQTSTHLSRAHNRPIPRIAEGLALAANGVVAAIDISDGLVDDLGKLCKSSGVGAVVRTDKVPADRHLKRAFPDEWQALALGGGEEYELLFIAPEEIMDRAIASLELPCTVIGEIVVGPERVKVVDQNGKEIPVDQSGWDHFQHKQPPS